MHICRHKVETASLFWMIRSVHLPAGAPRRCMRPGCAALNLIFEVRFPPGGVPMRCGRPGCAALNLTFEVRFPPGGAPMRCGRPGFAAGTAAAADPAARCLATRCCCGGASEHSGTTSASGICLGIGNRSVAWACPCLDAQLAWDAPQAQDVCGRHPGDCQQQASRRGHRYWAA